VLGFGSENKKELGRINQQLDGFAAKIFKILMKVLAILNK
jgi:hypothetical protein